MNYRCKRTFSVHLRQFLYRQQNYLLESIRSDYFGGRLLLLMCDDVVVGGYIVEKRRWGRIAFVVFSHHTSRLMILYRLIVIHIHFSISRCAQFSSLISRQRLILKGLSLNCIRMRSLAGVVGNFARNDVELSISLEHYYITNRNIISIQCTQSSDPFIQITEYQINHYIYSFSLLGIDIRSTYWTGWICLVPISDATTMEFMLADQSQNLLLFELHHADRTKLSIYSDKRVSYFWVASLFLWRDHHPWQYITRLDQKLYEFLIVFNRLLFEIVLDFLQIFLACKQSLSLPPNSLLFCCLSQTIEMSAHQDKKEQEKQSRTCRICDPVYVLLNFPLCFLI